MPSYFDFMGIIRPMSDIWYEYCDIWWVSMWTSAWLLIARQCEFPEFEQGIIVNARLMGNSISKTVGTFHNIPRSAGSNVYRKWLRRCITTSSDRNQRRLVFIVFSKRQAILILAFNARAYQMLMQHVSLTFFGFHSTYCRKRTTTRVLLLIPRPWTQHVA